MLNSILVGMEREETLILSYVSWFDDVLLASLFLMLRIR